VALSAFVLTHFAPGDATTELKSIGASSEAIAAERARLGLDRSLPQQIAHWARGLASGDLGMSSQYRQPVGALVVGRAGETAMLAAAALALATLIGLPLGVISGATPRHWIARVTEPISLVLLSCPPLVLSLLLLFIAATTGWLSMAEGSLLLPTLALALPLAASLERLQAQATRDVVAAPDLLAAAARGVPRARLIWVHAARQSLRPVLGIYGIVIGTLFGGSLVVEMVTAWPGLGRLMYDALRGRDIDLVAGCALAGAVFLAIGNVAADLLRALVDPRAREHA
jgi:ABC-type dipeptide/oligopeptide/nickel transport system permease component